MSTRWLLKNAHSCEHVIHKCLYPFLVFIGKLQFIKKTACSCWLTFILAFIGKKKVVWHDLQHLPSASLVWLTKCFSRSGHMETSLNSEKNLLFRESISRRNAINLLPYFPLVCTQYRHSQAFWRSYRFDAYSLEVQVLSCPKNNKSVRL